MDYLLLVLIVQTTDIEIGNESQHGSQQPTTTPLVHGNITYHEVRMAPNESNSPVIKPLFLRLKAVTSEAYLSTCC